ncbi:mucosa associated lymphoid tissue lymphoma translocation protein 1, isoform b [Ditylenchus destructor]|nr:mucosa associated lymphoid tissue lymphoma translocation protein 1, isoform b [Ditylenchus destructor]
MEFSLETNLLDLPYRILSLLAQSMDSDETWPKLFNDDRDSSYYLSPEDVERFRRMREPGAHLLRHLGHRGQTVKGLLTRLHALAKIYGTQMDKPQLLLRRKFCAVIWSRPEQVLVSEMDGGNELRLQCKATGFPTPHYQWIEGDQEIEGEGTSCLFIRRCPCTARSNTFRCKVWNIVEECHEWSAFYRSPGKDFQSELISDYVDLEPYVSDVNPSI